MPAQESWGRDYPEPPERLTVDASCRPAPAPDESVLPPVVVEPC